MCCFTLPVEGVSQTKLFARIGSSGVNQVLVYSMHLQSKETLAMILPIPVAKGTLEGAVKFTNLQGYSQFFDDMASGFPQISEVTRRAQSGGADTYGAFEPLKVVSVGAFDASFVPSIADFSRLDARFRLKDDVWKKLPAYADFGFAVFKLKPGNMQVHPMAFSFPTATPDRLFFPTLHIHDGEVHPKEDFDHTFYCQGTGLNSKFWTESARPANHFVKHRLAGWLIHPERHVYRMTMNGRLDNGDVTAKIGKVTF